MVNGYQATFSATFCSIYVTIFRDAFYAVQFHMPCLHTLNSVQSEIVIFFFLGNTHALFRMTENLLQIVLICNIILCHTAMYYIDVHFHWWYTKNNFIFIYIFEFACMTQYNLETYKSSSCIHKYNMCIGCVRYQYNSFFQQIYIDHYILKMENVLAIDFWARFF